MLTRCPDCQKPLHQGQHRYADGLYEVWYCKGCGFKKAVPSVLKGEAFGTFRKSSGFSL